MLGGDAAADTTIATERAEPAEPASRHAIAEVDAALRRIDAGTYGIDEETGSRSTRRSSTIPTAEPASARMRPLS